MNPIVIDIFGCDCFIRVFQFYTKANIYQYLVSYVSSMKQQTGEEGSLIKFYFSLL